MADSRFLITEVVSGTALGIDQAAIEWAHGVGIPVRKFPANWNKHGKRAGYLRNEEMADYADALIAIWDGESRGTKHMIDIAYRRKLDGTRLKVYVYIPGVIVPVGSDIVDVHSSTANMYGCEPCPRCGSKYRCVFEASKQHISCDDCQFTQLVITKGNT